MFSRAVMHGWLGMLLIAFHQPKEACRECPLSANRNPIVMAAFGQKRSSPIEEQFYDGSRDSPKPPYRAEMFVCAL